MPQWTNWAGDQTCAPAELSSPASRDEVAAVIGRAAEAGRTVRVAGAGHSFTPACLTDGTLISLERMKRVIDVDRGSGRVRVEAGITLGELSAVLWDNELAFENLGDIDVQSIAGATATGTHGTGEKLQNLSAGLHSIELTLADGSAVELSEESDPDGWRAARVSIGALGVVTAVTLQAVPAFQLDGIDETAPLDDVLATLDERAAANAHFEFFTFPHCRDVITRTNNRTGEPPEERSAAREWISEVLLKNHAFDAICRLGRARPSLIPHLNRFATRMGASGRRVDRSYKIFATPRRVRFTEMEYALPRAHIADAVRAVHEMIERRGFDVGFPLEVRLVAPDDAFLSPAGGRETAYLAAHMYRGMEWEPYLREVEAIMDGFEGRPHWGKRHFQTAETLRTRYPEWDRFAAVRARLDPEGQFANAYVDQVLGPVAAAA